MEVHEEEELVLMGSKDNNYKKVIMMMIKGKRTKRRQRLPFPPSLTVPSTSSAEPQAQACGPGNTTHNSGSGLFNSSSSTSSPSPANSVNEFIRISTQVEQDMANCLILLAQAAPRQAQQLSQPGLYATYQCKTCERCFPSFQALGGHRASHKRPKPSPAAALQHHMNNVVPMDHDQQGRFDHNSTITNTTLSLQISSTPSSSRSIVINTSNKSSKVHECSICGAEFGSGQALGGHMRRHRTILAPPIATNPIPAPNDQESNKKPRNILSLDLNLPAPEDQASKFPFAFKEKVIVFSASALVDCHQ